MCFGDFHLSANCIPAFNLITRNKDCVYGRFSSRETIVTRSPVREKIACTAGTH